ncbi:MAG: YlbF family regulator [Bacilli bacterium]
MNKELKSKLDEFIAFFLEVKEVKQFLLLKDELSSSKEIENLKEEVKKAQKEMALSLGTSSYKEKKAYYLSKKREYESHPLIVNYEMLKEEVNYLVDELVDKLKGGV